MILRTFRFLTLVGIFIQPIEIKQPAGSGEPDWRAAKGASAPGRRQGFDAGFRHQQLWEGERDRRPLAVGERTLSRAWTRGTGHLPLRQSL